MWGKIKSRRLEIVGRVLVNERGWLRVSSSLSFTCPRLLQIFISEASLSMTQIHPSYPRQGVSLVPIQCCHSIPFSGPVTKEESQKLSLPTSPKTLLGESDSRPFFSVQKIINAQSIVCKNSSFFCQMIRLQIGACRE